MCGAKALFWELATGCFSACSDGWKQLRSEEEESTELSHCKRHASFLALLHSPLVLCFTDLLCFFARGRQLEAVNLSLSELAAVIRARY
jgi:hypothetical protein